MYDLRAYSFNQRGIPVVTADFVSMDDNHGYGAPLISSSALTTSHLSQIRQRIQSFSTQQCDFAYVVGNSNDFLHWIANFEQTENVYLPMLKHLVESIGFSALHAISYEVQSAGNTRRLSCDLVSLQIATMKSPDFLWLDTEANKFHQQGVGVLVNDLPHIPFLREFEVSSLAL